MKVCIFITVVFLLFSCKKKEDVAVDNKFVFLSFGFPDFREDHLRKVIDEKWNIKRVRVAGCVVTDELLDSIKTENDKTKLALEKRFGKDWKVKYNQEFEDFQMKQVDVMDVMISNESFRKQLEKCNIPIDGINKNVKKIGNSDKYNVDIFDYKNHEKICFTTEVDIKLRTIKIK